MTSVEYIFLSPPGGIGSVSIHSSRGLDLTLQMMENSPGVRVRARVADVTRDEKIVMVKDQTEAQLTSRELETLQRDALYEESLGTLVSMFTGA